MFLWTHVGCWLCPAHVALRLWKQQSSPGRGSGISGRKHATLQFSLCPAHSFFNLKSILLFQLMMLALGFAGEEMALASAFCILGPANGLQFGQSCSLDRHQTSAGPSHSTAGQLGRPLRSKVPPSSRPCRAPSHSKGAVSGCLARPWAMHTTHLHPSHTLVPGAPFLLPDIREAETCPGFQPLPSSYDSTQRTVGA